MCVCANPFNKYIFANSSKAELVSHFIIIILFFPLFIYPKVVTAISFYRVAAIYVRVYTTSATRSLHI